jgi:trimeric autotransporter adhesin
MARHHRRFALRDTVRHTLMVAAALQAAFGSGGLHALPTGGQVVIPGSAQIGAPVNNALTVTNAPGAIINWQSFSIAPNELVRFVQQNAASAVLNRVTGSQMSEIMGRLQSNGRVFLVNPNGIVVGPGAVIDTAAFIGSTLPMLDRDFIDGRLRFQGDASSNGRIVNQGSIRTGFGGQVMLVSPNIENTGLIEAPGGQILLAAGKSVTITSLNSSGVSFELQAPTDSVVNIGQLLADGGVVRAFAGSLRHSGDIRANSLVRDAGGQIVLQGSRETTLAAGSSTRADGGIGGSVQVDSAGTTRVEGSVSATGSTGTGGRVEITGDRVVLAGTATADASGATGGGTVLVGGDWQGGNAAVRNATSTFVGSGVTLKADATVKGDGGTIVAWADGNTRFLGMLSARGGAQGGDGGRAEVSGRGELLFIGGADLAAPNGRFGSLLLDPLDLFIDTAGGLNPAIIDESTDFPNNAVTVSPATLAAITGNVTLYASRDMRFNSNVTLTGAGQSLTAQAGRDLQLGATLTTSNGAVSLNAGRSITTFGAPSIAAGTGAVSATAGTGSVTLGSVASAGSLTVNSNGNLSASTLTAAGPVVLSSASGSIDTGVITSGGGSVTLSSATSTSTSGITTAGGAISANAASGSVDLGTVSTIAGSGPAGGSLVVTAAGGTTFISNWAGGNGSATLSGRSVDAGTLNTTGDVSLTATAGTIFATIDNAASVTATANNAVNGNNSFNNNGFETNNTYFSSNTSINLYSSTVLNATSVTATATSCSFYSCPGASITLSGDQGVNVGNVVASAPPTTTFAAPFNSISESVNISSSGGSITARSAASQVVATDVTLSTGRLSGGGIGTSALPLRVNAGRSFTFQPNGNFGIQLTGSGPNQLIFEPGVATTGNTWSGSMTGLVAISASATDSTVTVASFSATSGFDAPVFSQSPLIEVNTVNGEMVVDSMTVPAGDQTGRVSPFSQFNPVIEGMPVTLQASGALTVGSFTRSAGSRAKATTFTADGGPLVLGTISGNRDRIDATGRDSVTIGSLSALGNVFVDASNGGILALVDGPANEITASGSVSLTGASIGTSGFTNPFDIAGNSVSLTTTGSAAGTGYIGSGSSPTNPVVAATQVLTINATRQFNVDTGMVDVRSLTLTAVPDGVTAGGTARVTSNGSTYAAVSDGTDFTLQNWTAPAAQFSGGSASFTTPSGNLLLDGINFSASDGNLTLRTDDAFGNVTQGLSTTLNLGSGTLNIAANNNILLRGVSAGGLSIDAATCSPCDPATFTLGNFSGSGSASIYAITRGAIGTGNLDGVGSVYLESNNGNVSTGAIEANTLYLYAGNGAISTGGGNINALARGAGFSIDMYATGAISTGTINSAPTAPGVVRLYSNTSVTTGTVQSSALTIGRWFGGSALTVNTGDIGGIVPGNSVNVSGSSLTLGAISLNTSTSGTVTINSSATLAPLDDIVTGDGSVVNITSNNTGPLMFTRIDTGSSGRVSITNPNGIEQTVPEASNGGIRANEVALRANGASGSILGPGADNSDLTLRGTTNLTIDVGNDTRLRLRDFAGSAPGPELVSLDITRSTNDSTWLVSGLAPAQALTLVDTSGGTRISLDSSGSAAPLAFRYRNNDSAGNVEALSIKSNGGAVRLETSTGSILASQIDTRVGAATGGGAITLSATGALNDVSTSGTVEAGSGSISVTAGRNAITTSTGQFRSTNSVTVAAGSAIGSSGNRFKVNGAPTVSLDGADLYADLAGTTELTLRAANTVSVASDTALKSLSLSIDATGTGPDPLITAPTQAFGLARLSGDLQVGTVSSTTPLESLQVTTTAGGMRVIGSGASSVAATSLRLESAAGRLHLDGTGNALVLVNGDQQFLAGGELKVDGRATLTATGDQTFTTFGESDLVFDPSGAIAVTGGVQNMTAGKDIRLLGGSTGSATVTLTATDGSQTLTAGGATADGSILLAAGSNAGVAIHSTGAGQQALRAPGNITLTGGGTAGGTEAASVLVRQSGDGGQVLEARGSIVLTGGIGGDGTVLVHNSGSGTQSIGDPYRCCTLYPTDTVTLQGGSGAGSSVELRSTGGQQLVQPFNALNLNGGTGSGAHARIASTSTSEQLIGGPSYASCCSIDPVDTIAIAAGSGTNAFAEITATGAQRVTSASSLAMTGSAATGGHALIRGTGQDIRTAATSLVAGTGSGADAQILSVGSAPQFIYPTSLSLAGGGTAGANSASARIVSGGIQTLDFYNPTTLTGGAGPNSVAEIRSAGVQSLNLGNLTLTGGTDAQSWAKISSGGSQSVYAGTVLLSGGTAAGTVAQIDAAGGQTFSAGNTTLAGGTGAAGSTSAAGALITNASGDQAVYTNSLTIRSGAAYAASGIVNAGTAGSQQVSVGGSIQITTSAGANTVDAPLAGGYHSGIVQAGSGGQVIDGASITVDNVHSTGQVGIANRGLLQTVSATSGTLSVLASGSSGTATIDTTSGLQSITGNSGIIVRATAGSGLAQIANTGGDQTFGAASGPVLVQASGGTGSAKIAASGSQTFTAVRALEVSTVPAATGNAEVTAGVDQSIHTTDGTPYGFSLKVAAFGTGSAKVGAVGNQLIEADYPELMQSVRDGRIFIGDATALGPSVIKATNQDIFARSITIRGGSTGAATAKLDSSGNQVISILTPSTLPSGITVAGGAGGSASLDPLVQTILSNGPLQVLGGSGSNAFALIQSSGPQTILVTGPATPNSVLIQGGSGNNAYAAITTPDPAMALGTSGGISLVGGTGANADAVFGNGAVNIVNFACGTAFTCTFTNLGVDPFLNPGVDVGIANNGLVVPLSSIVSPTSGPTPVQAGNPLPFDFGNSLPFDFSNVLVTLRGQTDQVLQGDAEQEMLVVLLGRRLPLCR